ncbi:hypothetical protein JVU11DRAFT_12112 [Chiua virens]|nr:hypothetical protein JVU11DRAFT_12112 [Chiua virens]
MVQKVHPQAQKLRIIIVTVPIIGATAYVLYDRLVNGKPQRTLPQRNSTLPTGEHADISGKKLETDKTGMNSDS